MTKVTFELEYEQVDAIVLQELKHCYETLVQDWENRVAVCDTRDEHWNLMTGFERVIQYFMVHEEYESYMSLFPVKSLND